MNAGSWGNRSGRRSPRPSWPKPSRPHPARTRCCRSRRREPRSRTRGAWHGIRPAQAQPPEPAHHLPDPRSRQRLAPLVGPFQLDQQHPVGRVRRILGGQVLEVGMDHRRARPPDLPATQYAVLDHPRVLGLGPALVRIELPMADVNVRRDALAGKPAFSRTGRSGAARTARRHGTLRRPARSRSSCPAAIAGRRSASPSRRRRASSDDAAAPLGSGAAGWPEAPGPRARGTSAAGRPWTAAACGPARLPAPGRLRAPWNW